MLHKQILLIACLLCCTITIKAQSILDPNVGIKAYNTERLHRNRQSMWILGGWATTNIAIGSIGMARSKGAMRSFHQMNAGWNVVNLGLAATGLWTAYHTDPSAVDLWQSLQSNQRMQRIFLFNAGLDIGYITAGGWMMTHAKTVSNHADRWRGFGRSIALQGAFLFVFDLGAFFYHHQLDGRLAPLFQHTTIGMTTNGLSIKIQ